MKPPAPPASAPIPAPLPPPASAPMAAPVPALPATIATDLPAERPWWRSWRYSCRYSVPGPGPGAGGGGAGAYAASVSGWRNITGGGIIGAYSPATALAFGGTESWLESWVKTVAGLGELVRVQPMAAITATSVNAAANIAFLKFISLPSALKFAVFGPNGRECALSQLAGLTGRAHL